MWTIATNGASIPLSNNWDNPDVNGLAAGPDGPHHFFAGCTNAIIYESDVSEAVPLLGWQPVDSALPSEAERFAISQHDLPPLLLVRSRRRLRLLVCAAYCADSITLASTYAVMITLFVAAPCRDRQDAWTSS